MPERRNSGEHPRKTNEVSEKQISIEIPLRYDVPPFVNESAVLRSACEKLAEEPLPMTCDDANKRVRHLAVRFYPVPEQGEQIAIAAACRVEEQDRDRGLEWDAASACITAWHGDWGAAVIQVTRAVMKNKKGCAAGVTRCVIAGLLVYAMPTALITMTANLLTDTTAGSEGGMRK